MVFRLKTEDYFIMSATILADESAKGIPPPG